MKQLTTVFAIVALTATLAACPRKQEEPKQTPKATETTAVAKPSEVPEPSEVPATDVAAAAGDLPTECAAYKAMADKIAGCEALGAQRDLLKAEFDKSWTAWTALPKPERAGVGPACKAAGDALKAAASACAL